MAFFFFKSTLIGLLKFLRNSRRVGICRLVALIINILISILKLNMIESALFIKDKRILFHFFYIFFFVNSEILLILCKF